MPEIIEPKENQDGGCENAAEAQIKDGGDNAGSDSDDADGHLIEKLKVDKINIEQSYNEFGSGRNIPTIWFVKLVLFVYIFHILSSLNYL